ncbi:MAG TPA: outer membrane protein assembly factor BamD [Polyangiaceae bacterium]|nr:outer membrane protein assembly factor BamD [Polyangiaceae bacterium]
MSDLKLVSPDQPTPLERRLLDAVANESPSAEQRMRVRLALGLPAVAPAPVLVAPVGRRALLLKAAGGLVVISAGVLALFVGLAHQPSAVQPRVQPLSNPQPASAASVVPPVVAPPAAAPSPAPAPVALGRDAHVDAATSKRLNRTTAADSGADLSEQLRLIDAARSGIASGNAQAAAAALSSYRQRFPRGPFAQEAAVLQIQTLDLQGNHALAAAQARSFLARYPGSPHASVVRRIAGQ